MGCDQGLPPELYALRCVQQRLLERHESQSMGDSYDGVHLGEGQEGASC